MQDLNCKPLLAIGSSNLHTGRPFTFSQIHMGDSTYESPKEYNPPVYFHHEKFPLSTAMMASSSVPFAFTPIIIDKQFFKTAEDDKRVKPVLVDGGVYDNQGIHKLTQDRSRYLCDTIIVSDAGGRFAADNTYRNTLSLLLRTVGMFMYRIKAFQMAQNAFDNVDGPSRAIAYYSLGWKLENLVPSFADNMIEGNVPNSVLNSHNFQEQWIENPKQHKEQIIGHLKNRIGFDEIASRDLSDEELRIAKNTATNLVSLSKERICYLIRHAENLTEVQIKLYCPHLIT